jgi:bacterial/archaeal transporter family protein
MSWIVLTLFSACLLGIYEVAKKVSVNNNPVAPVLYCNAAVCAACWIPLVVLSAWRPNAVPIEGLIVANIDWKQHAALFLKAIIVGGSWSFAYFAVKHLPVSIASPIRATAPVWTILIAVVFLGERPTLWRSVGMGLILSAFYAFSLVGRKEGIEFKRDKWIWMMLIATVLGSISSIYDKYLLQDLTIDVATVQAWFSIYLLVVLLPLLIVWMHGDPSAVFAWRWSIALIAVTLLAADYLYFTAIAKPDAMISVISTLRRTSMIVSLSIGVLFLGEKSLREKLLCAVMMLIGAFVIYFDSSK